MNNISKASVYGALSPFFKGDKKPKVDGVYLRQYDGSHHATYFCKYANGFWYCGFNTTWQAELCTKLSGCQDLPWCGLAQDPNA